MPNKSTSNVPNKHSRIKRVILIAIAIFVISLILLQPLFIFLFENYLKSLHNLISKLMLNLQEYTILGSFSLIFISFAYGVIHAVGIGHGKIAIASYVAQTKATNKTLVRVTFLSSFLQGFVGIALVSLAFMVFDLSSRELFSVHRSTGLFGFSILALLGLYLVLNNLYKVYKVYKHNTAQHQCSCSCPCHTLERKYVEQEELQIKQLKLEEGKNKKNIYMSYQPASKITMKKVDVSLFSVILSTALRPCSGMIFVLIFAFANDMFVVGILSALSMSLGTGFSILIMMYFLNIMKKIGAEFLANWVSTEWFYIITRSAIIFLGIGLIIFSIANIFLTLKEKLGGVFF